MSEKSASFGFTLPQRGVFFGVTTVNDLLALVRLDLGRGQPAREAQA